MSIIHEALKKAQNNLKEIPAQTTQRPTVQENLKPAAPRPSAVHHESAKTTSPSTQKTPQTTEGSSFRKLLPVNKIILALAGLGILFIIQSLTTVRTPSNTSNPSTPSSSSGTSETTAAPATPVTAAASAVPAGPIQPPVFIPEPQLVLNGVTLSEGEQSIALINNELYKVGDIVENMMVTSIDHYGVELQGNDRKVYLKKR